MRFLAYISVLLLFWGISLSPLYAQKGINDTIMLGAVTVKGVDYPMVFLDDCYITSNYLDPKERIRLARLRNDIYTVYPYALTAAAMLKDIHEHEAQLDGRRERKHYLKSIDKELDRTFKDPLKNLTIDQGHVLIKLIDRQTGENCFDIIKEVKGRFSAIAWESVGILFKNNLTREYDPQGNDRDVERIVSELEASNLYRYELLQQQAMMRQISKK